MTTTFAIGTNGISSGTDICLVNGSAHGSIIVNEPHISDFSGPLSGIPSGSPISIDEEELSPDYGNPHSNSYI